MRAAHQPKRSKRSLRYPHMASSVLLRRYNTTPGAPATTNQNSAANTASLPFSSTDSVAARATAGSSSSRVSRLTR
ncbi:hypothetical protein D3C81_1846070 [compost metagenome]